jgi:hypothetical protein
MPMTSSTGIADAIRYGAGPTLLRARWIVPVDMPPIEDGEVIIHSGLCQCTCSNGAYRYARTA